MENNINEISVEYTNTFINNNKFYVYTITHSMLYILVITCCFIYDYQTFSINDNTHILFISTYIIEVIFLIYSIGILLYILYNYIGFINNNQPFLELLRNITIKYPINKFIFSVCITLRLVLLIYTWNNVISDRKNNVFLPIQLSDITFLITSFFIFIFIIIQFSRFYQEIYYQFSNNNRVSPLSNNINNILKNKSYSPKKDDQCSICLCVYLENKKMKWIQLDCKHFFHLDCIRQWFQNDILCTCPLCRVENV